MTIKHKFRGKEVVKRKKSFRTGAALAAACAAISLAACGGGGGDAGFSMLPQQVAVAQPQEPSATPTQASLPVQDSVATQAPVPEPGAVSEPVPAPDAVAVPVPQVAANPVVTTVTLNGRATYDSIPNNLNNGLDYAAAVAKPIRAASVEILDPNGAPVASATTDDNGMYSATVPANTTLTVRVQALLLRSGAGANWDVSVRDNTSQDALYSIRSDAFPSGVVALARDLHAASGWGVAGYTDTRAAAPFAVMDAVYASMRKVESVAPATQFPALKVFWSSNNVGAGGDKSLGQIGTSHFAKGQGIYVLGRENVDTDEFDDSVIVHEWGHYYQTVFSRDDSVGGGHSQADRLDRRVAFSEGWGTGLSGIVLERDHYTDSSGHLQAVGSRSDLARGVQVNPGWYREYSILHIFWRLNREVGFRPIHEAMTSELFTKRAPLTSIHSFTAAFNAVAPNSAPALQQILRSQNISAELNDPFGLLEINAGDLPAVPNALPMHVEADVGVATAACVSNAAGSPNKLGNFAYFHFTAPASRDYHWLLAPTTDGTNLGIEFYRGGNLPQFRRGAPPARIATALTAGADYIAAVKDLNGTPACFNLTIE